MSINHFMLGRAVLLGLILLGCAAGQAPMSTSAVASINNLKNAAYCADTSVSANTITCSTAVGFTGYAAGQAVDVLLANSITAAATINVNGLGAKAVTYNGATVMITGIMVAGGTYRLQYDGTRFVMQGDVSSGGVPSGVNQFQWDSAGTFAGAPNLLRRSATSIGVGADAASSPTTVALSIQDFTTAALNEGVYLEIDKAGKTQAVLRGIDTELFTSAASNITTVTGQTIIISNDGASTMGSATGLRVSLENVGASTMTDEFGINIIGDPSTGVTNKHGLYIGAQTGASGLNEAIHTEAGVVVHEDVMTSANVQRGAGSPEGAVVGVVGNIYQRTDGGTDSSLYRKEAGSGNTGWVAVSNSGGASPAAPDNSIQYRVNGTTFGGMPLEFDKSTISNTSFGITSTGLNDATFSGTADTGGLFFCATISITGTPDSFQWDTDNCNTLASGDVPITGAAQLLSNGISITFAATTGHTLNNSWAALTGTIAAQASTGSAGVFVLPTGTDPSQLRSIFADPSLQQASILIGYGINSFGQGEIRQMTGVHGGALTLSGFAGDLSFEPSGQTPCTFATLGTVLTANGQSCYCSDCTVTSGADNTCAASGGGASVTQVAGADKCFI